MSLELAAEVGVVVETHLIADVQGAVACVHHEHTGPFDTEAIHVVQESHAGLMLEKAAEIGARGSTHRRHVLQRQRIDQMIVDVVERLPQSPL